MAGSSFFALFDDIAALLDDVAAMSKVAARKTSGVLGDDLALNAEQASGVRADRELPVVWAVAKGSFLNKLILVPAAMAISALAPWAITPLLMLGGAYLCYEGFEKLAHKFLHPAADDRAGHAARVQAVADPAVDLVEFERGKIRGAIRTDFILSAEIMAITLGVVADSELKLQFLVLAAIAIAITVGVYGLVAAIVKIDDLGLYLNARSSAAARACGRGLLAFAPILMKALSIFGTAAMFMVGGGILTHGIAPLHHLVSEPPVVDMLGGLLPTVINAVLGVVAGGVVLTVVLGVKRLFIRVKTRT